MKLTISIPALNEENAIKSIIERCLATKPKIIEKTPVTEVDIVVISDGSTDRTVEYAKSYSEIDVIVFPKNRGYGAAIMGGWEKSQGDLLSFLDADGTCDPNYFVEMITKMEETGADIVLGSRMGPTSKMPKIRRLGNLIFATILGVLSKRKLTDSASGMRIIRKSSLPRILPLPSGLHFTPAMSARALMDRELIIEEIPMHYEERIGRSKLSVGKDGLRFLKSIVGTAIYIKPSRITYPVIGAFLLLSLVLGVYPTQYYIENRSVLDWMIYRFIFISLLGSIGVSVYCATTVAEHMIELSLMRYRDYREKTPLWYSGGIKYFLILGSAVFLLSIPMIWPGLVEYLKTGHIQPHTMHWSRFIVAGFFIFSFIQFVATAALLKIIYSLNIRQPFLTRKIGI